MKSGSNERERALSLLTSGLRLMTGKVSGPPLFAASSHHPPKRRVTPSIWGKTIKMVIMRVMMLPWSPSQIEPGRIPLQSHDQDPEVDKPPFQSIKETYISFWLFKLIYSSTYNHLIVFELSMITWWRLLDCFWPDVSFRARKVFIWIIVSWLDNWQLTNDFHFENYALAKFT